MFERNSLAATGFPTSGAAVSKPSGGGKLNRRDFGICSWRPDSETVASRAFAQTPVEIEGFYEVNILPIRQIHLR